MGWEGEEVHRGCQWGNLREGDNLEDRGVDGSVMWRHGLDRSGLG
jgi:hypothetical protein